jgi:hypothetical protein
VPCRWQAGPQPGADTLACHGGRCPFRQPQASDPGPTWTPSDTITGDRAAASRIERIDGMMATIKAAITPRRLAGTGELLGLKGSGFHSASLAGASTPVPRPVERS